MVYYLNIGIVGFGSIGRLILKYAVMRGHRITGVVDIDENILGRDAGDLAGVGKIGVSVSSDLDALVGSDVVIHATTSFLDRAYRQLVELASMGVNIVSTCETLAYPYYRYPVLARSLDEIARRNNIVILGTGINPGFLLDTLVVVLASTYPSIKKIIAKRSLDASRRRESFRRKIGVGEDPAQVSSKLKTGELTGHVGYAESVYLIASAGDLELDNVVEYQEPVVAENDIESHGIRVERGFCRGIRGYAAGFVDGREVIRVELDAVVGGEDYEEILIETTEGVTKWRSTGTPGDVGTVSIVLNVAERTPSLSAGLRLMTELLPFRIRFKV